MGHIGNHFITHRKTESWGTSFFIMEKDGKAFCRVYWYEDDDTTIYLAGLNVNYEHRKQGIGNELIRLYEKIGRDRGMPILCLWVQKNSWMHYWYKRLGYVDMFDNKNEENTVWMKKVLTNN